MRNKVLIWSGISFFVLLVGMAYYVFMANAIVTSEYMKLQEKNVAISNIEKQKENEKNVLTEENKKMSEEMQLNFSKYKVVYLTFDDGPTPINTPKILEILKKNNVKGTFFVIGQNPDMYKTITDSGNLVALHTYSHEYKQIYKSEDTFFKDLYKIRDLVKEKTGIDSKITRFPGGSLNRMVPNDVMSKIIARLKKEGFVYQDWNCDSTDALQNGRPVPLIIENATTKCPYSHVEILMHDSALKVTTVEALQQIITYYKSRGYSFETLKSYSPKYQHRKS